MTSKEDLAHHIHQRLQWGLELDPAQDHHTAKPEPQSSPLTEAPLATIQPLLSCPEERFAELAIVSVFRRDPAAAEIIEICDRRSGGVGRAQILRDLVRRAAGENLPLPPDWRIVLPRHIHVHGILNGGLRRDGFIRAAFELILGRTPSAAEIASHARGFRWITWSDFLAALAQSEEAAAQGGEIILHGLGRRAPSVRRFLSQITGRKDADLVREQQELLEPVVSALTTLRKEIENLKQPDTDRLSKIDLRNSIADVRSTVTGGKEAVLLEIARLRTSVADVATLFPDVRRAIEANAQSSVAELRTALTATQQELAAKFKADHLSATEHRNSIAGLGAAVTGRQEGLRAQILELSTNMSGVSTLLSDLRRAVEAITQGNNDRLTATEHRNSFGGIKDAVTSSQEGVRVQLQELSAHVSGVSAAFGEMRNIMDGLAQRQPAIQPVPQPEIAHVRPPAIPGGDVTVVEVDGFLLGVPSREWRSSTYYHYRGPMEPGVYALFKSRVRPGMFVVDIGANIGLYTLLSARLLQGSGRVFSCEPAPGIFRILQNNIQLNGYLETGTVKLYNTAIADRSGKMPFFSRGDDSTHNSFYPESPDLEKLEVPIVSLDELLGAESRVDFVKIDIEGAEPLAIRGMQGLLKNNPEIMIVMEFAPEHLRRGGQDPAGFLEELIQLGLRASIIEDTTGELVAATPAVVLSRLGTNLFLTR